MVKILPGNLPRTVLAEGRNYGFGSSFAKRTGENEYTLLFGITACKDFLHDILLAEELDVTTNIYGLKYTRTEPFNDAYAYIAISMLTNGAWPQFNQEKERLANNTERIIKLVKYFEKLFKFKQRSSIIKTDDKDVFLLKVPKMWVSTTYLISLYTLLIRIGYQYEGQQIPKTYVKGVIACKELPPDQLGDDWATLKAVWPKIEWMVQNGLPKENFKLRMATLGDGTGWHNNGIVGVKIGDKKSKWLE